MKPMLFNWASTALHKLGPVASGTLDHGLPRPRPPWGLRGPACSHPAARLVEASAEQVVHRGILPVPAAAHRVDHLQIQTRSTAALPPAGGRDTCAGVGPGGVARGTGGSRGAHGSSPEGIQREGPVGRSLGKREGSRTYSRLVTEVSATELRLGIEGRVSPVEDRTWPPCRSHVRGQMAIR